MLFAASPSLIIIKVACGDLGQRLPLKNLWCRTVSSCCRHENPYKILIISSAFLRLLYGFWITMLTFDGADAVAHLFEQKPDYVSAH
jgi:hypothetical protein